MMHEEKPGWKKRALDELRKLSITVLYIEMSMSRNDSTVPFFIFLVGIGVGATAVILLGSKRIDQLRDDIIEVMNDGVQELRRQAQKTVNTARQKLDEAIDIGGDAYNEAKKRAI